MNRSHRLPASPLRNHAAIGYLVIAWSTSAACFNACDQPPPSQRGDRSEAGDAGASTDRQSPTDRQSVELVDPARLIGQITVREPHVGNERDCWVEARLLERPYLHYFWVTEDREGSCRYRATNLSPDGSFNLGCDPPCEGVEYCTTFGECEAPAAMASAGTIRVHGLKVSATLEPSEWGYSWADREDPVDLFDSGDQIWVEAEGDQLPAFSIEARGVDRLRASPLTRHDIVDGLPLEVSWTPGDEDDAMVELVIDQNMHGLPIAEIRCPSPDTGHLTVPARLLEQLSFTQDWYAGFIEVSLIRSTEGVVDVGAGPIRLRVESRAPREATRGRPLLEMPLEEEPGCAAAGSVAALAEIPWGAMELSGQAEWSLVARSRSGSPGDLLEVGAIDATGALTAPTLVTTTEAPGVGSLDLRAVGDQGWLVWSAPASGDEAIYFARLDRSGTLVAGPIEIADTRAPFARDPQLGVEPAGVTLVWIGGEDSPQSLYMATLSPDGTLGAAPQRVYIGEGPLRAPHAVIEQFWRGAAWLEERDNETAAYYGRVESGEMIWISRLTLPHHQTDALEYTRGLGVNNLAMGLFVWTEVHHAEDPRESYSFIRLLEHDTSVPLTPPIPGQADRWPRAVAGPEDWDFSLVWVHGSVAGPLDQDDPPPLSQTTLRQVRFHPDINSGAYNSWPRSEVVELEPPDSAEISRPKVTRTAEGYIFGAELTGVGPSGAEGTVPGWGAATCD